MQVRINTSINPIVLKNFDECIKNGRFNRSKMIENFMVDYVEKNQSSEIKESDFFDGDVDDMPVEPLIRSKIVR